MSPREVRPGDGRARRGPSLRVRLALLGLAGILVPLAVLLLVSMASQERQDTVPTGDGVVTERTRALSPWVPLTAAGLALPAAAVAWWWAGRAVAPLRRVTALADDIQLTSLDRRIGRLDAPEEVGELGASFDRMLDRLDAATTAERRFVEDVSHQLRTPIATLIANADVALADPGRATVAELTEATRTTKRVAEQLARIVDELLATARAEQHRAGRVAVDLVRIAREVREAHAPTAHARTVDIRVEAPETCTAAADELSVRRAIGCLVENAVRHTHPGTTATVELGTDERGRPFVAVADEGPGIAPEHLPRIFERYWSSGEDGGSASGLGIGLAIVKQVADAHGGIEIESPITPTGGTRFTLHFAAPAAAPARQRASSASQRRGDAGGGAGVGSG